MLSVGTDQRAELSDAPTPENSSASDPFAANDDILTEILMRLPVRSLFRLKSVSKRWNLLISNDPHFSARLNPDPCSVSALFLHYTDSRFQTGLQFIPLCNEKTLRSLTHDDSLFRSLTHFPGLSDSDTTMILNACHGLLLCWHYDNVEDKYRYHVLNPTTKKLTALPDHPYRDGHVIEGLWLAHDPSRSPHYKVVSVRTKVSASPDRPYVNDCHYQIEIYSSETGSWKASGEAFSSDDGTDTLFGGGVYWNGAVNWLSNRADSLYFNLDEERLGTMPMLPVPEGKWWYDKEVMHYGESRRHLHLVEIFSPTTRFNVYEMERDYSGWFVKFRVDLAGVATSFPEMTQTRGNWYCSYSVLSLVRGESDEESFLVLQLADKLVRYNLADGAFMTVYEVPSQRGGDGEDLRFSRGGAHPYIESYSCV
ncbi:hypothetical protein U1Q18_015197 [Sarracenia purpurea var. burkii]